MRSIAFVNVLLPPKELHFENHPSGSTIEVAEDQPVNITCHATRAKPEPELSIYLNGKRISSDPPLHKWSKYHGDGTTTAYASLQWKPTKLDHGKLLACEANHPDTGVNLRNTLSLHVFYSSDRPQIAMITSGGDVIKVNGVPEGRSAVT